MFSVCYVVEHLLFDYRGVIFDVDACFEGSDEWYEQVARSRPSRDRPWYHVLPDGAQHTTYVAERNLALEESPEVGRHPLLATFFDAFEEGRYSRAKSLN